MSTPDTEPCEHGLATCASRTVGIFKEDAPITQYWFVAIVLNNTEIASRERLIKQGHTAYVPTQPEVRKWKDGRTKTRERVLLKNLVLVHATENERKHIVAYPFIRKFMTDSARKKDTFNQSPIAIIPEQQVEQLKFMLLHSDSPVTIESTPLRRGDQIKVVRGKLQGMTGEVITEADRHSMLVINLGILGCAKVRIDLGEVERM